MKISLESTSKIVSLNGQNCRVWEGETETGIKCHAYIKLIVHNQNEESLVGEQFARELQEVKDPSPEISMIPERFII